MHWQKAGARPNGLDNGSPPTKKRKQSQNSAAVASTSSSAPSKAAAAAPPPEIPKIQPGERLADFAARVDQALPVAGLARKGKSIPGVKERTTKHAKRLQKMQAEWRKEEARIREREEEARELAEEEEDERGELYGDVLGEGEAVQAGGKKGRKGKRRGRMIGEDTAGDEEDPWAVLKKRERPIAVSDVVQAPPVLKAVKERFKVRGGARVEVADVPGLAGSLRRREELGETRRSVIERYRQMMEEKRSGG